MKRLFGSILGGCQCLVILILPVKSFAQVNIDLDAQMERMKGDYQSWLSTYSNHKLFVEYDPSPLALDILEPRFSWILDLDGRNRKQTGYQLLVASSKEILDAHKGDIWDTGLVVSNQSTQVKYKGTPLQSNKDYYWKVRFKDESGKLHPYNESASFSTGLFQATDWSAKWIGCGDPCEMIPDPSAFVMGTATEEVKNAPREKRSPIFRNEFKVQVVAV